jgi:hypothetical protein
MENDALVEIVCVKAYDYICTCGGISISPFRSLLHHWIALQKEYSVTMVGIDTPSFWPTLSGSPMIFSYSMKLPYSPLAHALNATRIIQD